jgi:hypothetical protein
MYSRGWVDLVPDPILLSKCGSAGNRTWICSQELWPLDHRGIHGRYLHGRKRNLEEKRRDIHASSEIRTQYSSAWTCLRARSRVWLFISKAKLPFLKIRNESKRSAVNYEYMGHRRVKLPANARVIWKDGWRGSVMFCAQELVHKDVWRAYK